MMGHLNRFSASGGGELEQKFSKNSNARGVARGGLLKLRLDWYITTRCDFDKYTIILHFGGKHHQNLCHPEIKDHRQI